MSSIQPQNTTFKGPSGITALMDACASGKYLIARMLLRFNADVNLRNEHDETAADLLRTYFETNREQLSPQDVSMCQHLMSELEKKTRKRPIMSVPNNSKGGDSKRLCDSFSI